MCWVNVTIKLMTRSQSLPQKYTPGIGCTLIFFSVTSGVLSRNTFERLEAEIHGNGNDMSSVHISSTFVMFMRTS